MKWFLWGRLASVHKLHPVTIQLLFHFLCVPWSRCCVYCSNTSGQLMPQYAHIHELAQRCTHTQANSACNYTTSIHEIFIQTEYLHQLSVFLEGSRQFSGMKIGITVRKKLRRRKYRKRERIKTKKSKNSSWKKDLLVSSDKKKKRINSMFQQSKPQSLSWIKRKCITLYLKSNHTFIVKTGFCLNHLTRSIDTDLSLLSPLRLPSQSIRRGGAERCV